MGKVIEGVFLYCEQSKQSKQTSLERNTFFGFGFDCFRTLIRALPMNCFDHMTRSHDTSEQWRTSLLVCSVWLLFCLLCLGIP